MDQGWGEAVGWPLDAADVQRFMGFNRLHGGPDPVMEAWPRLA